jgi:flagellar assembly protein FliH
MMRALRLPDLAAPPPKPKPAPPPDPALLAAIRAEGEAEGHARGLAEGIAEGMALQERAQAAEVARTLGAIAAALDDAAQAGRRAAEDSADAVARLLAAAIEAALPGAAERAGADLVPRLLLPLLPAIADRPEAKLRVAPALAAELAARLPPDGPVVEADATMPPGDARVEWRDGAWVVSREARWRAVREALASAGLVDGEQAA